MKLFAIVLKRLLGMAVLCLAGLPVYGQVISVTPDPTGLSASIDVRLDTRVPFNQADTRQPIGQFLKRRPTANLSPAVEGIDWEIICSSPSVPNQTVTSLRGEFVLDGERLTTVSKTLSRTAGLSCTLSADETLTLTGALSQAVIDVLLQTEVRELLATGSVERQFEIEYQRRWTGLDNTVVDTVVSVRVDASINGEINASALTSVVPSTRNRNFPAVASGNSTFPIDWDGTVSSFGTGSALNILSNRLTVVTPDGQVLHTVNRRLSKNLRQRLSQENLRFSETAVVPNRVALNALNRGHSRVLLVREFSDGDNRIQASLPLALGGASGGPLQITRIGLEFEDHSRIKVFPDGALPNFLVNLNVTGSGMLKGRCEAAGPVPPSGVPFFRSTRLINVPVTRLGNTQLRCPAMAVNGAGVYFARFTVLTPELTSDTPLLRYYGITAPASQVGGYQVIRATGPSRLHPLSSDTRFAWQPVAGAGAYRLEIYRQPFVQGAAVSGMELPASTTAIAPTRLVLDNVKPGQKIWWRVIALGEQGAVIGESAMAESSR